MNNLACGDHAGIHGFLCRSHGIHYMVSPPTDDGTAGGPEAAASEGQDTVAFWQGQYAELFASFLQVTEHLQQSHELVGLG